MGSDLVVAMCCGGGVGRKALSWNNPKYATYLIKLSQQTISHGDRTAEQSDLELSTITMAKGLNTS
jgi:hypothetical protein